MNAKGKFVDLYALLGVEASATAKQIKKAYRKKALKLHPDKVKGTANKEAAAKLFDEVTKAAQLLEDETARQKYDSERKVRLARKRKLEQEDSKFKAMRAELERKEQAHMASFSAVHTRKVANTVRRQNEDLINKMLSQGLLRSHRRAPVQDESSDEEASPKRHKAGPATNGQEQHGPEPLYQATLSVKWKWKGAKKDKERKKRKKKEKEPPHPYSEDAIRQLFSQYGRVKHLLYKPEKNRAMIDFSAITRESANRVTEVKPLDDAYSLKATFLSSLRPSVLTPPSSGARGRPPTQAAEDKNAKKDEDYELSTTEHMPSGARRKTQPTATAKAAPSRTVVPPQHTDFDTHEDYEADTLRRMMEAAARRRNKK